MRYIIVLVFCIVMLAACKNAQHKKYQFKVLTSSATGIDFENKLTATVDFNLLHYMYYYNGAGVGVADFNNDGKQDVFFAANQSSSKLYLNKGGLKFHDVSQKATLPKDSSWTTGVSVVDINNDGWQDIYLCRVGKYKLLQGKNALLINKGLSKDSIPQFEDQATEYGLDFSGFGTQAAFTDFDLDGDLDMFLLNHNVNHNGNYADRSIFLGKYDSLAGHKFYINNAVNKSGVGSKQFEDATQKVGINSMKIGYGLGITVSDINMDGWPDIYVGNDFHENDYLYINQKNGTYKEVINEQINHTSMYSMGVDVADINNDAFPDIISADMLPNDPIIYKRSLAEDDYNIYNKKIQYGYNYQYARNNVQLNNGNNTFSEIGQFAGVYNTDWSWAPLWLDYNNDGFKDLFVSNGIPKRMNDIDYNTFVGNDVIQTALRTNGITSKELELINQFPEIKLANHFFTNNQQLQFSDDRELVANNKKTFSNGAAYADFDNDGDLDIIVNNINDKALIYENLQTIDSTSNYISVALSGSDYNKNAIGAQLIAYSGNELITVQQSPVRGFLSSMQMNMHLGVGNKKIDSIILIWPDRTFERINVQLNKTITAHYKKGLPYFNFEALQQQRIKEYLTFQELQNQYGLQYLHKENSFNEFDRDPLLAYMQTTCGPALAIGDLDGDGSDDVFVGAGKTHAAAVFFQKTKGKFTQSVQPALAMDSLWEFTDAQMVDVNGDQHLDIVAASGGNEFYNQDQHLLPRVYLNNGKGQLQLKPDALPNIFQTQNTIRLHDADADGDMDMFVGCNAEPWNYGSQVNSFLLMNDGTGKFTDATNELCADLKKVNMVSDAIWCDINSDGKSDLITTSLWGGIHAFLYTNKKYIKQTITNKHGMWYHIQKLDIDNDGDTDFFVGNMGINNKLNVSEKRPATMYHADLDGNGKYDQVVTYYLNKTEIPLSSKMEIERRLPFIKKKYLFAADYAKASANEIFNNKLSSANKSFFDYAESIILVNDGKGNFSEMKLPMQLQWSSTLASIPVDINNDGFTDLITAGNFYDYNVQIGRLDASTGAVLINNSGKNFVYKKLNGTTLAGQVRRMGLLKVADHTVGIAVKNNDSLKIFSIK